MPHAIIKAITKTESKEMADDYCGHIRHAFFINALDISKLEDIAQALNINWENVMAYFNDGHALADLYLDFSHALTYQVSISPAWVFNEGRQRLIGNVGYRVIEANLKELIEEKPMPQLWC